MSIDTEDLFVKKIAGAHWQTMSIGQNGPSAFMNKASSTSTIPPRRILFEPQPLHDASVVSCAKNSSDALDHAVDAIAAIVGELARREWAASRMKTAAREHEVIRTERGACWRVILPFRRPDRRWEEAPSRSLNASKIALRRRRVKHVLRETDALIEVLPNSLGLER